MADKIRLDGMIFYASTAWVRRSSRSASGSSSTFDVERDLRAAGRSDDPADTVNYAQMYRVVKEIVEGPSRKLLESVAESIAEAILDGFDVESVTVTVKKPEVPIKGSILSHAAVEIRRVRG